MDITCAIVVQSVVLNVFKVDNEDIKTMSSDVIVVSLLLTLITQLMQRSANQPVFINNFEQVFAILSLVVLFKLYKNNTTLTQ